jgi:hypothetical protein
MTKYITLHPQYFLKEGFGTLMSHYAVMYSLYKDLNVAPIILDINFRSQKLTSAMEAFNQFNEEIIYHDKAFNNFKQIFQKVKEIDINNYDWVIKNFANLTYEQLLKEISLENNNLCCIWSLNSELIQKYSKDIINYLYVFNENITNISKNYLPKTNKQIVGICVRNEYKKSSYPHTQLTLNFYIEAMKNFDIDNSKYLIFSDDIEESKKMFSSIENNFDISYTESMQSAIGLCALSLCNHIICANSSFSYWASLLNKNLNKKIICSTKFIDENKDPYSAALLNYKWYPEDWIPLDLI